MTEEQGPTARARRFVGRVRRAPGSIDEVASDLSTIHAALDAALDTTRHDLARLEELAWAGRDDTRGGVTAVGDELGLLNLRVDDLTERLAQIDAAVSGQAAALHRAIAAPARRAATAALRNDLGEPPELVPGLSVFTLCWNHGSLLAASIRSGLAALDQVAADHQGQVLVLDDASSDDSAAVADQMAAADPRVRVIRSPLNLGLALARSTLLHAATTSHAFQLDADNTAVAEGVAALYEAARETGATLTYGNVIQVDGDGVARGPVANEPPSPALFQANYIDTMAVVDVAALRDLGGWSSDPLLEHVDDWAAVHQVIEAGQLLAFVPALVGRYLELRTAFHHSVRDRRIGAGRIARVSDPTGRRQGPHAMEDVAAVAYDPVVGPLWATPAAVALNPDLAPRPPTTEAVPEPSARVLVLAPGGVGNVGDDAITVRGLERLRAHLAPDVAVDLVTDGPHPTAGLGLVRWLGPLVELLPGLDRSQLGPLDATTTARAAARFRVGEGHWDALDPTRYDAAVFIGGGSLVSEWSEGLVGPRALLAAALRGAEVPYALSGQGIGPLDDDGDRDLVAGLLSGAVAVACRDVGSAELAVSLDGVDPTRVVATGDDALGLAPPVGPEPAGGATLVVTVRSAFYVGGDEHGSVARRWMLAADALAAARGWDVVGLALNRQDPHPEIATLAAVRASTPLQSHWRLVDVSTEPRRLVAELARAQAVATQSFHAAVLALDAGVPAVLAASSPYYVAKASGLALLGDLPPALGVTDPALLGDALDQVAAAVRDRAHPLADRAAAVDDWWTGLPTALHLTSAHPA